MLGVHHTDGFGQVPEDSWIAEVQDWGHVVLQDPGELAAHPGKKLHEDPDGLLARTALPSALRKMDRACSQYHSEGLQEQMVYNRPSFRGDQSPAARKRG